MSIEELRYRIPEFTREHIRVLLALGGSGIAIATLFFSLTRGESTEINAPLPSPNITPILAKIFVDVAGKVAHPGVYQLDHGARAIDALTMAGGAKGGVDLSDINLAHVLSDGEQIYVGGANNSGGVVRGKLNINRATKAQFDALPGIGPVLAARIVTYRAKNGPFISVDDLQKVSGIGGAKFDDIKDRLRI